MNCQKLPAFMRMTRSCIRKTAVTRQVVQKTDEKRAKKTDEKRAACHANGKATGYISKISGYISKISGYISKISGYISKISGYISKINGKQN